MTPNYGIEQVYITPVTGFVVPDGGHLPLTEEPIPVWKYPTIRITSSARVSNPSTITVNVITAIPFRDGWESFSMIKSFTLAPHENTSFTLDVPAQNMFITASASGGSGANELILVVFGYRPPVMYLPKPPCC